MFLASKVRLCETQKMIWHNFVISLSIEEKTFVENQFWFTCHIQKRNWLCFSLFLTFEMVNHRFSFTILHYPEVFLSLIILCKYIYSVKFTQTTMKYKLLHCVTFKGFMLIECVIVCRHLIYILNICRR